MRKPLDLSLYLVTDRGSGKGKDLENLVQQAALGGVSAVQLREKHCTTREYIDLGRKIKKILEPYNIPLFINDRVDVALAVKADGIHLGQSDMQVQDARDLIAEDMYVGLTIDTLDQVRQAEELNVHYLGVGPVFPTLTKTDCAEVWGLEGLKSAHLISRHPLVAIGGINLENASEVVRAGADGIAVVSAICAAPDPCKSAADLLNAIHDQDIRE